MTADGVVHLIDDDEAVRQSLTFSLAAAGLAVRAYESADRFLSTLSGLQPGCVVTDIRMPGLDGLELQRRLRAGRPDLPLIVMTGHADVRLAVEAMKAGAVDFLEKPFDDELLLTAIRAALARYAAAGANARETQQVQQKFAALSEREREVLAGLVAGNANKVIAQELNLSPRTVEVHRANIMAKTGAASLPELVRMALVTDFLGRT